MENDNETLNRLVEELERLSERFKNNKDAIEALEAVKYWATEESIPSAT
jgi:hypothetical protein